MPGRRTARRSFLARVIGGTALLPLAACATAAAREERAGAGCTDADAGPGGDPRGQGRRCAGRPDPNDRTDRAPHSDAPGCCRRPVSDRDRGAEADPPGKGRGRR